MAANLDMTPPLPGSARGPHESSAEELVASFEEADRHERVDLSGYAPEDWIALGFFWLMTIFVFLQFFTRYVMNDSFAWTEELATYCLIAVVFVGSAMCVRRCRHIQVDFLYRYLPHKLARVLSTAIDFARTAFFAYAAWLVWRYVGLVGEEPMTTIQWNKSHVYWVAFAGFVLMCLRSVQVSWQNWRQGYSILERPEAYDSVEE